MSFLSRLIANYRFERPSQAYSMTEYAARLQRAGERIDAHLESAASSESNQQTLRQLIGIERWGQRRLRVALQEPLLEDDYTAYLPDENTGWDDLKDMFSSARLETVNIAYKLEHVMRNLTIPHNTYGNLTIGAWLQFLLWHANRESKKLT